MTFSCCILRYLLAILFSTWLVPAQPSLASDQSAQTSRQTPSTSSDCQAAGGKWGRFGLFPEELCNMPASDFGKKCTDSSECEGDCLAQISKEEEKKLLDGEPLRKDGQCTKWVLTFGCHPLVQSSVVRGILCQD